ncbi:MAG: hypothetical protein NZ802_10225, partial [Candidatus Poseidoniales archaeon]|nr:hypothetical protein [Candidatus Poseidoniales archaeon]
SGPTPTELGGLIVAVIGIAILFKMMYSNPESGDSPRGDHQPTNPEHGESDSVLTEDLDYGKDYVQSIDEIN